MKDLAQRIRRAWAADTSSDPDNWTPGNPAYGQCAVTALLVQDEMGGVLWRCSVAGVSHYWNRLPGGIEIDLTREQFPVFVVDDNIAVRDRDYVLGFPDTARRYERLRERVAVDCPNLTSGECREPS